MKSSLYYPIPWKDFKLALLITLDDEHITEIDFVQDDGRTADRSGHKILRQLDHYFVDPEFEFSLKLAPRGTPFQLKVWQQLQAIPCGQVRRYGEIARHLQTSPRAVGMACRANPIPLIVPCHRVVAANHLGGYGGHSQGQVWQRKLKLLQHENAFI